MTMATLFDSGKFGAALKRPFQASAIMAELIDRGGRVSLANALL